jgi:hypothetical protein
MIANMRGHNHSIRPRHGAAAAVDSIEAFQTWPLKAIAPILATGRNQVTADQQFTLESLLRRLVV